MTRRSYEKELLDADNIPFADILLNMQELNVINKRLGGHKITCKGVDYFLNKTPGTEQLTIAEIGCGGGDNLIAIEHHLLQKKRSFALIGIDIKEECIQFAKQNTVADITWICSDYSKVAWPGAKPDIIFSSLFCHHFTDEQLIEQMQWLKVNSRLGFFINDLHRHSLAYYSIRLITKAIARSYLLKYDAPLSVMRGFKSPEWVQILAAAGITGYTLKWQWAFRYLICVSNEQ